MDRRPRRLTTTHKQGWATVMSDQDDTAEVVVLEAMIPGVPLSVNDMYTHYMGKMVLKAAGKNFKALIVSTIAPLVFESDWRNASHRIYSMGGHVRTELELAIPGLRNKTWRPGPVKVMKKGTPRSPYKKLDASNYIKLIEDGLATATGIDDSLSESISVRKLFDWDGEPEVRIRMEIWLPPSS